jgi:hypothetical protein
MNVTVVEDRIAVLSENTGISAYDFDFELHFRCTHPYSFEEQLQTIIRVGAIGDYDRVYSDVSELGLTAVNTPEEHLRASELTKWYPVLESYTPKSLWFELPPTKAEVESEFDWPVFIKGSRQTAKHDPSLSIASNPTEYESICERYVENSILHWQKFVVREYVPLARLSETVPGKVPGSVEFRTFWWRGNCVGVGNYWYQLPEYHATDLNLGVELAETAAEKLDVPFLVIDIAKTKENNWIIIECNDAQESGYGRINPNILWSNIIENVMPEEANESDL